MERVAYHLQIKANSCPRGSDEFDLFGRSAFNRYYYAAYLAVRSMLGSLNETWSEMKHAKIPEVLTGEVLKKIRRNRRKAISLKDVEATEICRKAEAAAHDLAKVMKNAYAVRVVADYNLNITVNADIHGRFQLYEVSITVAHGWPNHARLCGEKIRRAWSIDID